MDAEGVAAGSVQTQDDIGSRPQDLVRRWLVELKLSSKGEDKWRKAGAKVYQRYRGEDRRKNSFNILWANTDILRPAIYNSTPKPDVRRRYRDADPLGKAAAGCLSRALDYSCQTYDLNTALAQDVLDMLLPGRGVSRVRYVPSLREDETLEWEQAVCEHVNWKDFRRGPGRTWNEVQWVGFRHQVNRQQLIEQFGEDIGNVVKLEDADDQEVKSLREDDPVKRLFATVEIWEIWDKESKRVLFICNGHPQAPLQVLDDPLGLQDFLPVPKPLQAIEDTDRLEPIPLFSLYEEQADELDALSRRINRITDALKLRGVYDSTITEMAQIMRADDNALVPAKNVSAFLDRGGIDKMVWWWPIEQAASVLSQLVEKRAECIQAIWQLTGIADIMRGDTDANETATAQGIKTTWGTIRLQRLQKEVQRYARDLIRMMGEVIARKFQPETLAQMTELPFATAQQMQTLQAQQGQPSTPPIAWDQVMQLLRNNAARSFHIDIEIDSTVAAQLQGDMQGLQQVLTGVVNFIQGIGPSVQQGAMPIEAVKEIVLTIARRARLGSAVEDALDKIQAPQGGGQQGEAQLKAQTQLQIEQQKTQAQLQMHGQELQQKMQLAQVEAQSRAKADADSAVAVQGAQAQQRQLELSAEAQLAAQKSQADHSTAIAVAQINAASRERVAAMQLQHRMMPEEV